MNKNQCEGRKDEDTAKVKRHDGDSKETIAQKLNELFSSNQQLQNTTGKQ